MRAWKGCALIRGSCDLEEGRNVVQLNSLGLDSRLDEWAANRDRAHTIAPSLQCYKRRQRFRIGPERRSYWLMDGCELISPCVVRLKRRWGYRVRKGRARACASWGAGEPMNSLRRWPFSWEAAKVLGPCLGWGARVCRCRAGFEVLERASRTPLPRWRTTFSDESPADERSAGLLRSHPEDPHSEDPGEVDVNQDVERILFSPEQIERAVDAVALRVTEVLGDRPVTVIGVLKGSCIFCADLMRRLPFPLELSFAGASSYRGDTQPGELELQYFPHVDEVSGRDVLLVDDILDSGRTLDRLTAELLRRGASSVRTCVLLDKPARRAVAIEADFRCFEVGDIFVVGYGLDYAGRYRNLPYVAELRDSVVRASRDVTRSGASSGTSSGTSEARS